MFIYFHRELTFYAIFNIKWDLSKYDKIIHNIIIYLIDY